MRRAEPFAFSFGCVAASMAAWGLTACGLLLPDDPVRPSSQGFSYGGISVWATTESNQVTVCTDGSSPAALEFKDGDGHPVRGGGGFAAPGCIRLRIPPSAASVHWDESPASQIDAGRELPMPLRAGQNQPFALQSRSGLEYEFNGMPLQFSAGRTARAYSVQVLAASKGEAKQLVLPVLDLGPGSELPWGVKVGVYVEAELVGAKLVIRSSLVDRFDEFRIEVDGQTVAELHSRTNVSVERVGAGWVTVTATLPMAMLPEEHLALTIAQKGGRDSETAAMNLSF